MGLRIVPITQKAAKAFVTEKHRHHKAPVGSVFQVAVSDGENIRGVAMVGRPVARALDDGATLEVNRLCTDGASNACSMLYAAAKRIARELGWRKLITYILGSEPGTSLKATGWICEGKRGGGSWDTPSRRREDAHPVETKLMWSVDL